MATISQEAGIKAAFLTIKSAPSRELTFTKTGSRYSYPAVGGTINVDESFFAAFVTYAASQGSSITIEDQYRVRATAVPELKGQSRTIPPARQILIGKIAKLSIPTTVLRQIRTTPISAELPGAPIQIGVLRQPSGTVLLREVRNEGKGN